MSINKLTSLFALAYNVISSIAWRPSASFRPLDVTAIILNKNYYSNLHKLVQSFVDVGIPYANVHIIDLASSNPATLRTYSSLSKKGVNIIQESDLSYGPWILWRDKRLSHLLIKPHSILLVSDSDIFLPDDIPRDWLVQLFYCLKRNPFASKAALPLRIRDIDAPFKLRVIDHEIGLQKGLWRRLLSFPRGCTFQGTDTTIALYKPFRRFNYHSLRLGARYEVMHLPWYNKFLQSDEYSYYRSNRRENIGDWHKL